MADKPTTAVDIAWEGGFKFVSRDAHGRSIAVDAPENDGDGFEGFMPGELMLTRYCSVGATLGGRATITSTYEIVEETD